MDHKRYRVKSPVKTFRDLEVYQKTIQLSNEFTSLEFLKDREVEEIREITEKIPILIGESFGSKYESGKIADSKLSEALILIARAITKIDILRDKFRDNEERKEELDRILTGYEKQRIKILNLKKAWNRIYSKENEENK